LSAERNLAFGIFYDGDPQVAVKHFLRSLTRKNNFTLMLVFDKVYLPISVSSLNQEKY